ncbi:MAG: MBL fold metallo-hydrolase [Verrucomicrobiae bacterium]|nr:MBL fold metallo-hydrolase [Verrucomicrobiae bacterium]
MKTIRTLSLEPSQAALWWLGQAGYVLRAGALLVAIDPYLTDSAAGPDRAFARLYPPPLSPESLEADVMILTHDHQDHLDPETLSRYPAKASTRFVAPRHTARKLRSLGIPAPQISVIQAGDDWQFPDLKVTGVFALPTGTDVLDTTGYLLTFANGRTVYHTSDTAFHPLVLTAAPREPEVLCVPINGKWGNLGIEQALALTVAIRPRFVLPNHFDLMALNAENPETFRWQCRHQRIQAQCVVPDRLEPFVWGPPPASI